MPLSPEPEQKAGSVCKRGLIAIQESERIVPPRHTSVQSSGEPNNIRISDAEAIERILDFLAESVSLEAGQRDFVRTCTRIVRHRKGTVLLAQGDIARQTWLVVQGCVRVSRCHGGRERTLELLTEFHPVVPPTYGSGNPSPLAIECIKDLVATVGTPDDEANAYSAHPSFESVCRILGEVLMTRMQATHLDAMLLSPEERFLGTIGRIDASPSGRFEVIQYVLGIPFGEG